MFFDNSSSHFHLRKGVCVCWTFVCCQFEILFYSEQMFSIFQVDEAVAVLQAHQAKEAAQKAVNSATGVPTV